MNKNINFLISFIFYLPCKSSISNDSMNSCWFDNIGLIELISCKFEDIWFENKIEGWFNTTFSGFKNETLNILKYYFLKVIFIYLA